ncbi:hypothetical protein C9925_00015 [cyanobacterium G8-9]|nr:hypothetical protein C9925_00015 [cyanobacterium G8-9]
MNELQIERLTNLLTNPYTWIGIVAIFSLTFILPYIRRFYPQSWQEAMAKEEACNIEHQQRPEIRRLRNIFFINSIFIVLICYLYVYQILEFEDNKILIIKAFSRPIDVFIILVSMLILLAGVIMTFYEKKIVGKKNCENVIVGARVMNFFGYILGIPMLLAVLFAIIFLPRHYTVFDVNGIKYSKLYEWGSHQKKYSDISKIEFLTKQKCQNIKIYFNDNTIWDLKEYKELKYRGNKKKLVEFVSTKSGIEVKNIVKRN